MGLRRRWLEFCAVADGRGDRLEAFAALDRLYRSPGRHYHTWRHVGACLRELRRVRRLAADPAALELALWFHDAVYQPGARDNEERSAELAGAWGRKLGFPPAVIEEARRLVLATRHAPGRLSAAGDEALIRDIDLAVLGSGACRYRVYERRIGREYAHLPPERFRAGRAALLRGFLDGARIYSSDFYWKRRERRARRNLARACARLLSPPGAAAPGPAR